MWVFSLFSLCSLLAEAWSWRCHTGYFRPFLVSSPPAFFLHSCYSFCSLSYRLALIFFLFPRLSFGNKMAVPKANRVLNPPINVFSKTSTNLDLVGKEIIALDKYRWMQPLSELVDVHFQGLYGNFFVICVSLFSKISQSIIVSWKL